MFDAQQIAEKILHRFANYREQFQTITAAAKLRFEKADWHQIQVSGAARIDLFQTTTAKTAAEVVEQAGMTASDSSVWLGVKACYQNLIVERTDFELAETFYNSIYCKVFNYRNLLDSHMFIRSSQEGREINSGDKVIRCYSMVKGLVSLLGSLMDDFTFNIPWENRRRDIRNLVHYVRRNLPADIEGDMGATVDVIKSVFYRNKAAYIVGRVRFGHNQIPFVLPVLHNEKTGRDAAVYIDTAISDVDDVSIIFSFTRSYFFVDVNVPSEFIRFLHSLIPMKSKSELYTSIGFYKHGKAEFYRSFSDHLNASEDNFVAAPGIKGMVMTVFTLPSFPVVFKVIKDRFSSSKNITRATVKDRYRLVKRHDRVGRMADTQEFMNFVFPLERFSEELLVELKRVAGSSLVIDDKQVLIRHLWTERRMTPLNLYIDEALSRKDEYALFHAINEYGKAIKQLAAANIFAGDMLFKNFGVTRHGRVVFYDYDEIVYLTECNFRQIPEPLYPEQELAGEPWYSVGQNDVFPEEFNILTACNSIVRKIFNELHGDLLGLDFWREMQQLAQDGEIVDVFPYRKVKRFPRSN